MRKIKLISACLIGIKCRYDGRSKICLKAKKLFEREKIIPVCPEQLGGLPTPRIPSEVVNGNGTGVIKGKNKVIDKNGKNVTAKFLKGAQETLKIAKAVGAQEFIGKSKSPSCGAGFTYDGTFSNKLLEGDGVTAALLKSQGIRAITEKDLDLDV